MRKPEAPHHAMPRYTACSFMLASVPLFLNLALSSEGIFMVLHLIAALWSMFCLIWAWRWGVA